uniref:Uncharacterized protein n=1 Tax=Cucumis melo TaxID=3656 RepID=A0A9I9D838_CUCME
MAWTRGSILAWHLSVWLEMKDYGSWMKEWLGLTLFGSDDKFAKEPTLVLLLLLK